MSFANVGRVWNLEGLRDHLATRARPAWARTVTIHHCAAPSLAQRPDGFRPGHVANIEAFYRGKGWKSGPHGFVDEFGIHGMTPFTEKGVHAVSFNGSSVAFEMLGDYDVEDPRSGRGLSVCRMTAGATRVVLEWLGVEVAAKNILFHRFDPKTTKTCPGTKVSHDWFVKLVLESGDLSPAIPPGDPATVDRVPLVAYVAEKTGTKPADLAKMLRTDGGLFYLGEQWIEGAYYDRALETTIAPRSEADEAVAVLTAPVVDRQKLPVVATMADRLRLPYAAAAKRLRFEDGYFKWDGKLIVGAVYDRATQTTVAPADSLKALA